MEIASSLNRKDAPVPNMEVFATPKWRTQRFRVTATGETGTGVSESNATRNVGRLATIGDKLNVLVIDVCLDETGEVRTYRQDKLEQLPDAD